MTATEFLRQYEDVRKKIRYNKVLQIVGGSGPEYEEYMKDDNSGIIGKSTSYLERLLFQVKT